jgi:sortase A
MSWLSDLRSLVEAFPLQPAQQNHRTRKAIPTILMIVGAGLLGYVASQYAKMADSQRKLEAEWQRQAAQLLTPSAAQIREVLTRIMIPKIGLDAIVVEGDSREQLLAGPGHLVQTAAPGESGNAVITAHRDTFFRRIYELNSGDKIEVLRNGRTFHYLVTGKKIVKPQDVSVLKPAPDARLTLITCYPTYYIGPAPERLVVFSRLVE